MPNRAASVADHYAGPHDTIAIDGGFDTWTYPAYGAHVSRRVVFIKNDNVPDDAQWVVIDHAYNRVWRNVPDMGKFWNSVGRGKPAPSEERLQLALERDPRFTEVFYDARLNQAVFRRRGQGAGGGAQMMSWRKAPPATVAKRDALRGPRKFEFRIANSE